MVLRKAGGDQYFGKLIAIYALFGLTRLLYWYVSSTIRTSLFFTDQFMAALPQREIHAPRTIDVGSRDARSRLAAMVTKLLDHGA